MHNKKLCAKEKSTNTFRKIGWKIKMINKVLQLTRVEEKWNRFDN